jgi:hypothetical protein
MSYPMLIVLPLAMELLVHERERVELLDEVLNLSLEIGEGLVRVLAGRDERRQSPESSNMKR